MSEKEAKRIVIERTVESVKMNVEYKGALKISDVPFDYTANFVVPIPKFLETRINNLGELREAVIINLSRDKAAIELTDDEYRLFASILFEFIVKFNELERIKAMWSDLLDDYVHNCRVDKSHKTESGGIGLGEIVIAEVPLETCQMLNADKFGVKIAI